MKLHLRTRSLREVRKDLMVPGVIYGKSIKPVSIEIEEKLLKETLITYGKSLTFPVTLNRKKHNVYIKNIQKSILNSNEILNFELHCIANDETITTHIPLVVHGKSEIEKDRLFVQMNLDSVECEYAAGQGVSFFEFDVAKMKADDVICVKDILVPTGITIHEDLDQVLFIIKASNLTEEKVEDDTEDVTTTLDVDTEDSKE